MEAEQHPSGKGEAALVRRSLWGCFVVEGEPFF